MHLTRISLPVRDATVVATFYADVLGLSVRRRGGTVLATVGSTELELRESLPATAGVHHLAFTVPTGKLTAGKLWLHDRAALLTLDGQDEFETSPSWNARSVYFEGPEGTVLELIERRDLDNATPGSFSSADLLSVSEVGISVPDVQAVAGQLSSDAGIHPYGGAPGDAFAAVGDVHGLLILVTEGRPWFPTVDRVAAVAPTSVEASGARVGTYAVGAASTLEVRD